MVSPLNILLRRIGFAAAMLLMAGFVSCAKQQEADVPAELTPTAEPAGVVMETTSIPVADRTHFPVLADAYRRVDPKADGWDTEAFSEQASATAQTSGL